MHTLAGLFILWQMEIFTKPPITFNEQISLLANRGLLIENEEKAKRYLSNISYYRLSAYWYTFLEFPQSEHKFKIGSRFSKAVDTYVFDRKLRFLIFEEIERIEISLRTQLIYQYCHAYESSYWFEDLELFKDAKYFYKFHELIQNEINRTNEVFIKHYKNKYSEPENPPAWMILELASFGQISTLYKNLKDKKNCKAKKNIAKHYGVADVILESWLESLSFVRNTCAHHMRLWNRKLPKKPTCPNKTANKWLKTLPSSDKLNRIYIVLAIIQYLLKSFIPTSNFANKLKYLLNEYPDIPKQYMGFPNDWENEDLWNM